MADLSVPFMNDLEAGRKWASPQSLAKIVSALNIKPFQLFIEPGDLHIDKLLLSEWSKIVIEGVSQTIENINQQNYSK